VRVLGLLVLVGCSYSPSRVGVTSDTDATGGDDDGPANTLEPLHLGPGDGVPGTDPLTLDGNVTINTDGPAISTSLPPGVTFDVRPQLGGGPELAVLHVAALTVTAGADVRITGARPFVIVAGGDVEVLGVLDAGARNTVPGAGGALPDVGDGAGVTGAHGVR
jgi:hypothetical protein